MESKVNDYQLRQGDKVYVFSTSIVENAVRLSCKNASGKIFSRDFSVLDINSIDPIFNEIKSENEAVKFIDKALNVHKVGVTEDSGVIKIIFYVTTKGIIHTIEIPLGESGKNAFNDNMITSSVKTGEESQPIEIPPQASGIVNYGNGEAYGQQLFYSAPNIGPNFGEATTESNFNVNEFMSQYQTTGGAETFNSYQIQGGNGFSSTNIENIGSFMLQDNKQYTQPNYEFNYGATNSSIGFEGMTSFPANYSSQVVSGNDYNANSYEFTSNQYTTTTNNNYTYQGGETTFDINSLNIQPSYGDNSNQYSQPIATNYNQQTYQEYESTARVKHLNDSSLPIITPADPLEINDMATPLSPQITSTNYEANTFIQSPIGTSQYGTHTSPVVTSALHLPLNQDYAQYQTSTNIVPQTQLNQQLYTTQYVQENEPAKDNKDYNQYFQQTTSQTVQTAEQYAPKESNNNEEILSPQKESIQPQAKANDLELQQLKTKAAEVEALKAQLAQLEPLKKQVAEMESLKAQLLELNTLRAKVDELKSVQAQLGELNSLRQQVGQINILQKQLEELNYLRAKAAEAENLKKKVEELEKNRIEYENEIKELRETSAKKSRVENEAKGLESKQITFEDKPEQIYVKGDIIHDTAELEMLTRKINKLNRNLTLNLLYKASADSDKASAFHGKCDDAQSTIVLVETDKGKRFGGYTTCSWRGECIDKKDVEAFVFSLDKMKTYDNIPGEDAVGCYPKFGPIFLGCQIRIYDNAFSRGGTTFEKGLNFNTEEDYELTGGERTFNVKEIEVYEVIHQ